MEAIKFYDDAIYEAELEDSSPDWKRGRFNFRLKGEVMVKVWRI